MKLRKILMMTFIIFAAIQANVYGEGVVLFSKKVSQDTFLKLGVQFRTSPWQRLVTVKKDYDSWDLSVVKKKPNSINNHKVIITFVVPGTLNPGMIAAGLSTTQLGIRDQDKQGYTITCLDIDQKKLGYFHKEDNGSIDLPPGSHSVVLIPDPDVKKGKKGPTLSVIFIDSAIITAVGTPAS